MATGRIEGGMMMSSKSRMLGKGRPVLLAYATLPVSGLRDGFRSVQLRAPRAP